MSSAREPAEWGLDGRDGRRLADAMRRTSSLPHYRRLQAVMLVARGWGVGGAARATAMTRWAVYKWVGRYLRSRRPADLADAPRSGRPKAAGRVTDARIVREFGRDPLRLGYMATEWTVPLLAGHLGRKYGCEITPRTLRRRVRALGLRWKRPRHVFARKDPNGPQKKGALSAA
jgi:transposase